MPRLLDVLHLSSQKPAFARSNFLLRYMMKWFGSLRLGGPANAEIAGGILEAVGGTMALGARQRKLCSRSSWSLAESAEMRCAKLEPPWASLLLIVNAWLPMFGAEALIPPRASTHVSSSSRQRAAALRDLSWQGNCATCARAGGLSTLQRSAARENVPTRLGGRLGTVTGHRRQQRKR